VERPLRARKQLLNQTSYDDRFRALFATHAGRVFRVLDRLTGDYEMAQDLTQEAFVQLYRRGQEPDRPEAWLITVALNLFRNARSTASRRARLLTPERGARAHSDPATLPSELVEAAEERAAVRIAIDQLDERERLLLLLRSEGYSYRELARELDVNESSVGTLLARARRAFRAAYEGAMHAHR